MVEGGWDELDFWKSTEWTDIQGRLDAAEAFGTGVNPARVNMFAALDACPYDTCKVAVFCQDPYPQKQFATGVALAIPKGCKTWPMSLCQVLGELQDDVIGENINIQPEFGPLTYTLPEYPDLKQWTDQGVLLWNVVPSCQTGKSLSHYEWPWSWLTKEIIEKLNQKPQGYVAVFLGAVAREFEHYCDDTQCLTLWASHPSPRGNANSHNPFRGSRIFTKINAALADLKYSPIDWRLK